MRADPWQIPVLVMAGIILTELVVGAVLRRWADGVAKTWIRTAALGLLAVSVLMVLVVALGPSLADQLASVAAAVAGFVALWLAYLSYRTRVVEHPPADGGDPDPDPDSDSDSGERPAGGEPDPAAHAEVDQDQRAR